MMDYVDYSEPDSEPTALGGEEDLLRLLARIKSQSPPGMVDLIHENGFKLLVGPSEIGCAQFSPADDQPPYLMAVVPGTHTAGDTIDFMYDGSLTEIPSVFGIPYETLRDLALHFFRTGERSAAVEWEEI